MERMLVSRAGAGACAAWAIVFLLASGCGGGDSRPDDEEDVPADLPGKDSQVVGGDTVADFEVNDTLAEDTKPQDTSDDEYSKPPSPPTCDGLCFFLDKNCGGDSAQFADKETCFQWCDVIATLPIGTDVDEDLNTVGCRTLHAFEATDPSTTVAKCGFGGPSGGGQCGTWCDNYCYLSAKICPQTFHDNATCLEACAPMSTEGKAADLAGDSVQCRVNQLVLAGLSLPSGAEKHCPNAAPDGGAACVDPDPPPVPPTCAEYCDLMDGACADENTQYADKGHCLEYCLTWAQLPAGALEDASSNSIGCRMHFAGLANEAPNEAATLCVAAGPSGGDACGTWCENYCHLGLLNCTFGDQSLFESEEQCLGACAALPTDGNPGDASGDSVQCRIQQLGLAGQAGEASAGEYCPAGAPSGGTVCVDTLAPSCEAYCATIQAACTGDNAQYGDVAACEAYCETWAQLSLGAPSDTVGNTVGCRTYHASVAAEQPGSAAAHCAHAGASGGDVCGSWCDNLCHLAGTNCAGGNALFASDTECATACEALDAGGSPGDVDGDSVQCRIYHLGVAGSEGETSATVHCPHGGPDGAGVCAEPPPPLPSCAEYCAAVTVNCAGPSAAYADEAECIAYCEDWAALPIGAYGDTNTNTVGCRLEQATEAALDASLCASAGPSGGNVCGSWCDNLCHLAGVNCTGPDALFADDATCAAACDALPADAAPGVTSGDSVQCRLYHLGVAGSAPPDSAAVHCPHGGPDGGGVCAKPPEPVPDCGDYCAAITAACSGDDAQYPDEAACQAACEDLPPGALEDTSGNTLGCRQYWAGQAEAAEDPSAACAAAGPAGGDTCGSWCEVYCELALSVCVDAATIYGDTDACMEECAAFPVGTSPAGGVGIPLAEDTVQCRLTQLLLDPPVCAAATPASELCVDPPTDGDLCSIALATGPLPVTVAGSTADKKADYTAAPGDCPGELTVSSLGPDAVHQLVAGGGPLTIVVTPEGDWDPLFYVVTDCEAIGASCLAAADSADSGAAEEVTLTADEGETIYIIVDSASGDAEGDYELEVTPCDPSCGDAVCGADACGGSCGVCGAGTVCGSGSCLPGDTCAAPIAVGDLPWEDSRSLAPYTDAHALAGGCASGPDTGTGTSDVNYTFTPPGDAIVQVTLTGEAGLVAWVSADCGTPTTCLHSAKPGLPAKFAVDGGATLTLFVDGGGDYTIELNEVPEPSCAAYCEAVQSVCFGDTTQYFSKDNCLSSCADWAGFEKGTALDVDVNTLGCRTNWADQAKTAAATAPELVGKYCDSAGLSGGDVCGAWCENYCTLMGKNCPGVFEGDEATCSATCEGLAADAPANITFGDSVQCRISFAGLAGSQGVLAPVAGCLSASPDGLPECFDTPTAGDVCEAPDTGEITELPYSGSGNTKFAADDYSLANGSCPGEAGNFGVGALDRVVKLTVEKTGEYPITLAPQDFDAVMYVVSDCGDIENSCVAGQHVAADAEPSTLPVPLVAGQSVFIIVDGAVSLQEGHFGLIVGEVDPSPSCTAYCNTVMWACNGDDAQYQSSADCLDQCATAASWTPGAFGPTLENSTGCRLHRAFAAGDDPGGQCAAAGPSGGDVCGSWCDNYCQLASKNCVGADALYADQGMCEAACADFATTGTPGEAVGDTVQCRLHHLMLAGAPGQDASAECKAGSLSGAGVCSSSVSPECEVYCGTYAKGCGGDLSGYASEAECYQFCTNTPSLPLGVPGSTAGNSISCRSYYAGLAVDNPAQAALHCEGAGPFGGDLCGSWCTNYCYLAAEVCVGESALYDNSEACSTACADLNDEGASGTVAGNSIQCRLTQLKQAALEGDPSLCASAAPDGGAPCVPPPGDSCDDPLVIGALPFLATGDTSAALDTLSVLGSPCSSGSVTSAGAGVGDITWSFTATEAGAYRFELDPGFDGTLYLIGDCADAAGTCAGLSDEPEVGATESVSIWLDLGESILVVVDGNEATGGKTFGPYQLSVTVAPPDCGLYCTEIVAACTGDHAQYAGEAACVEYCSVEAALPAGTMDDAENTVGCRLAATKAAELDPGTHCPAAGPSGANQCGSWCDVYCDLATKNCTEDHALYADAAECQAECAGFATGGGVGDTVGDSVQCRIYHLGVAGSDASGGPAIHCPHGGPDGGGVCVPPAGSGCANPLIVSELPYDHSGPDTASDTLSVLPDTCAILTGGGGAGTNEEVHAFTAESATLIAITVTGQEDGFLYVLQDGCPGACDVGAPVAANATATIHRLVAAAETIHVVVDGGGPYALSMAAATPECGTACDVIMEQCVDTQSQYADHAACVAYCASGAMAVGTFGDTGNSTGCRAAQAVAGNCLAAGPTGGDVCGSLCDNYCTVASLACVGSDAQYADDSACETACIGFATDGSADALTGDSVQCRLNHLGAALTPGADVAAECLFGGPDGEGICGGTGPDCVPYCETVMANCSGEFAQYSSVGACLDYCQSASALPSGTKADTAVNTIGCRTAAAQKANDNPAVHCESAGPTGGNLCGSWCDVYCDLALTNCEDTDALFADATACHAACAGIPTTGTAGDTDGDTVQCRIYHLGVAGDPDAGGGAIHCPHGAVDGGGVCVKPPPPLGEACENPTVIATPTSFFEPGSTVGKDNDHILPADGCGAGGTGASSPDIAFGFSVEEPGTLMILVTGLDFDVSIQVVSACDGSAESCIASANATVSGQTETLELSVTPGASYVLIIDGATNTSSSAGTYVLDMSFIPLTPTCEEYCTQVTAACTDEHAQYTDEADCLGYCGVEAQLPLGGIGDGDGNSVGCRTTQAAAAQATPADAATLCPAAGPSGGNVCGTWCDTYCALAQTNCTGDNALFANPAECQTACGGYTNDGVPGATAGDSVQCRIYHLGVAGDPAAGGPAVHCPHGGIDGAGVCGDVLPSCADYCASVTAACTGAFAQYDDKADCLAYCGPEAELPIGSISDAADNTVGCRQHFASLAAETPEGNCTLAGPSGGGVCGGWCDVHCHLAQTSCQGVDALFASDAACQTACAGFSADGAPGALTGDSVQCRIAHLTDAAKPGGASLHCPYGGVDGGGVCAPAPSCGAYCGLVATVCAGDQSQYGSQDECQAYCETYGALPLGAMGDVEGNSVGCRLTAATLASDDPPLHCAAAGPTGADVCGTWCANYCHLAMTNCTDGNALYADQAECEAACAVFPSDGLPDATAGDSVQCRIRALGAAGNDAVGGPAIFCPHGSAGGGGVCVAPQPTCEEYCTQVTSACTGDDAQFQDQAACLSFCATTGTLPPGKASDTDANSIGCRLQEATSAASDVAHCAAAGPTGANVCGTWCAVYCHLSAESCTGDDQLWPDLSACLTGCAAFGSDGAIGATEGDNVQCRLHHLILAGEPGGAGPNCPKAAQDGGLTCVADPPPTCDDYCTEVMAACTGDNVQYADLSACLAYCGASGAQLPAGTNDDTTGNTLSCRINAAKLAVSEPASAAMHCASAGKTGANVCGTWCEAFCHIAPLVCTGANAIYPDTPTCSAACSGLPDSGAEGDETGHTIQCRTTFLLKALDGVEVGQSCSNAAEAGGITCYPVPEGSVDISGWTISQTNPTASFEIPGPTVVADGDYVVIGNSASAAALQSFWFASFDPSVHYIDSGGALPTLTADSTLTLTDTTDTVIDGPTIGVNSGAAIVRQDAAGDADAAASWLETIGKPLDGPTPGSGQTPGSGAGVHISKVSDAEGAPGNAYVELFADLSTGSGASATYSGGVQAVFQTWCANGCHANADPAEVTDCAGGTCFASNFAATQLFGTFCQGLTVGECTIIAIQSGTMPKDCPECVPPTDTALINEWIAAGMPE